MPVGRLFVRRADLEQEGFVERTTDELETDREPVGTQSARDRDPRLPGQIERERLIKEEAEQGPILAADLRGGRAERRRDNRAGGRHQDIERSPRRTVGRDDLLASLLSTQILIRGDEESRLQQRPDVVPQGRGARDRKSTRLNSSH